MASFIDEDQVWKCPKHPSKRRKSGICPICLRDRLITLCPDCTHVRPCSCYASTSSSFSSSSSLSRFAISGHSACTGTTGGISNLMDVEPPFRRSISMSIPFMRSKSRFVDDDRRSDPDVGHYSPAMHPSRSWTSFWSLFKKSRKARLLVDDRPKKVEVGEEFEQVIGKPVMLQSRSTAAQDSSSISDKSRTAAKGKGWYFPSPIKAFRQSKLSKIVQERSPIHRG